MSDKLSFQERREAMETARQLTVSTDANAQAVKNAARLLLSGPAPNAASGAKPGSRGPECRPA